MRGKNKRFTRRQMAIVELIARKKSEDQNEITLDEVVEAVADREQKLPNRNYRNAIVVSMNHLIRRLSASGVYIEKADGIGRGVKQVYRLSKRAS